MSQNTDTLNRGYGHADPRRARGSELGAAPGSAGSPHHCPKCGKLKLTPTGNPHKCGPSDKQRIHMLEMELASLQADKQRLDWLDEIGRHGPLLIARLNAVESKWYEGTEGARGCIDAAMCRPNAGRETPGRKTKA